MAICIYWFADVTLPVLASLSLVEYAPYRDWPVFWRDFSPVSVFALSGLFSLAGLMVPSFNG
jgi:hypothetical protein